MNHRTLRLDSLGRRAALAGLIVAAGGGLALAQPAALDADVEFDRFVVPSDPTSVALSEGARPLPWHAYALGAGLRFGTASLTSCVGDPCTDEDLAGNRLALDLVAAYGLGRVGVHARLPLVLAQSTAFDGRGVRGGGVGDLRLGGKLALARGRSLALAWDLEASLPTGTGTFFVGDAGTVIDNQLIGELRRGRLSAAIAAGYRFRSSSVTLANYHLDDELLWSGAAEWQLLPQRLAVGLQVAGRVGVFAGPGDDAQISNLERPVEGLASARIGVSPGWHLEVGGGVGAGGGSPGLRGLVALRWTHVPAAPPKDGDGDGVVDPRDACPNEAEDPDGNADEDGCPEVEDRDGDAVPDLLDRCPTEPEDADGNADEDGCPEVEDADADGVLDAADRCPTDPEDRDGVADDDGCAEDDDADGVADAIDGCRTSPEDADGFEDGDGCPDPDDDADGYLDGADGCPREAETFNGQDDADGCPDAAATVVVGPDAVEIKDAVVFKTKSAVLDKRSFQLLDGVVAALQAHPTLRVRVEGHTDDVGRDAANLELSQRRASAVVEFLFARGVDATRLEAVGYGETQPRQVGTSKEARAANRRVEFKIVGRDAAPPT